MVVSNMKATIQSDICKVWDIVLAVENYSWRSDLSKTEIDFTEYVTVKKIFMKPFIKLYLRKQQAQFVADLKKAMIS